MLVHMRCSKCQSRPLISHEKLNDASVCATCGSVLEIDLNSGRMVFPDWADGERIRLHECVKQAETIGRPDCARMFGPLDGLTLVDSPGARDFFRSIEPRSETKRRAALAPISWDRLGAYLNGSSVPEFDNPHERLFQQQFGFNGPEEFERLIGIPEQLNRWQGFPPLQTESAEAVVLLAIWKSLWNGDSFAQLAGNARVITNPVTHLRADHSWSQGQGGSCGTDEFYVLRTGEQQYLCANKSIVQG